MTTNTGGTAFPGTQYANGISPSGHSEGMTLRDYFAAKALEGLLASNAEHNHEDSEIFRVLGEASYKIADAMLKARDQ